MKAKYYSDFIGISKRIVVPLLGMPDIFNSPPKYLARSLIPIKPNESLLLICSSSMPFPLSLIVSFNFGPFATSPIRVILLK